MRHVSILIAVVVPLACAACGGLFGPSTTIQVEGQVTAADTGSPIPDASVRLEHTPGCLSFSGPCPSHTDSAVRTDTQGYYSLSIRHGSSCSGFRLIATAPGFNSKTIGVTCNEKLTIDIQL